MRIFLAGRGYVDSDLYWVDKAVNEYDNSLKFDYNEQTGQYCIFKYMGARHPNYPEWLPVLAFDRVPPADQAIKRLIATDSLRFGEEILRDIQTRERDPELERRVDDATGLTAEGIESWMHREGKTNYHRSLAKKDPKQQNKGWDNDGRRDPDGDQ